MSKLKKELNKLILKGYMSREELEWVSTYLLASTDTRGKHLIVSHMTPLSLNWRHMDLMDGPLGG